LGFFLSRLDYKVCRLIGRYDEKQFWYPIMPRWIHKIIIRDSISRMKRVQDGDATHENI